MASYLSQAKFAELCGISRQSVNQAIKKGRIHLTNGRIDPAHPTNRYFRETGKGRAPVPAAGARAPRRGRRGHQPGAAAGDDQPAPGGAQVAGAGGGAAPVPGAANPSITGAGPKPKQAGGNDGNSPKKNTGSDYGQLDFSEIDESASGSLYKNKADLLKTIEYTRGLQIKNERERNQLISRDIVKRFFGELYTIETTELLTLGEKLAPEIAALFGLDDNTAILDVGKYIQKELSTTLEHIEDKLETFLKSFQVEET